MPESRSAAHDRASAALVGLAIGDAMGMPSQTLTAEQIAARYGRITDFVAPYEDHPVSHGLSAARVTDDTEQAWLLARHILADPGRFDDIGWAEALLEWERGVRARGLRDLLGPSSKAAIDAIMAGSSVAEAGRTGTTNGAAMRILPVGIATALQDRTGFLDAVTGACRATHFTGEAIAGAAAVAAVVSQGIGGGGFDGSVATALALARAGNLRGNPVGERDMAGRIALALEAARSGGERGLARGRDVGC